MEDYDVVLDTLEKARMRLWAMTQRNMESDMMNIMDDVRLGQVHELSRAISMWKDYKCQVPKSTTTNSDLKD